MSIISLCKQKQKDMKKYIPHLFQISLIIFGVITLLLLGAEPGTSESSMYEYEHYTDKGHFGWYLVWGWVVFGIVTLISFIIMVIDSNRKLTK